MDRDFLRTWSEYLFKAIQPSYDGGVFSIFDRENDTQFISKVDTYIEWTKSLIYKPYYNVGIGLSLLWSIILFMTVIILLILLCCRKLDCCFSCRKNSKKLLDAIFRECLNKKLPKDCCICAKKESLPINQDLTDRAIFVTVIVLIFGLIVGIYYSVTNSSDFQNSLTKSNSSYTFLTSVDETINHIESFLNDGVSKGNVSTWELLSKFNTYFTKVMDDSVYDLSNSLLTCYGALPTLNYADVVIGNIDKLYTSMTYITNNKQPLFESINRFLGTIVNFIKPFITDQLPKLCNSKPDSNYRQTCQQLVKDCELLSSSLRESEVKFDSISVILHLLRVYNINFATLSNELEKSKTHIKTMIASMHYDVHQNFKIDTMLAPVSGIWMLLDKGINSSIKVPINEFQQSKTIEQYSSMLVKYWKYFFDATLAILVCLGVTAMMTCVTAVYVFVYKHRHKRRNRKEAYRLNLVKLYQNQGREVRPQNSISDTKPAPDKDEIKDEKTIPVMSHLLKVLTIFHLFWGGVMILPCLFASASFLIGGLLTTEVCRYLVESKGVTILDSVIDPLLDSQWNSVISNINLTKLILPINLNQPQLPMKALYSGCAASNATLLTELNMTGILDATAITKMPLFTTMVSSGQVYIIKKLLLLNLQYLIPTSLVGFIDSGVEFLKKFVDPMDQKPAITALQKPILKMDANQFGEFVKRFDRFLKESDGSNAYVIGLKRIVNMMSGETEKYRKLTNDVTNMRTRFQIIEDLPPLAPQLVELKRLLLETSRKLKDRDYLVHCVKVHYPIMTNKLINSLDKELTKFLTHFENSLFPCKSLYSGYGIMVRSICGNIRSAIHSYTLSLVITIIWVQMLFCFSWCLLSRLKPKLSSGGHSKC